MAAAIVGLIALAIILPLSYLGLREYSQMLTWHYEALNQPLDLSFRRRLWISVLSPLAGLFFVFHRFKGEQSLRAYRYGMCLGFAKVCAWQNEISEDESVKAQLYAIEKIYGKPL